MKMPHSEAAETAILSALMQEGAPVAEIAEKVNADYFFNPANSEIYRAILNLFNSRKRIDLITVGAELGDRLVWVGDHSRIADIQITLPSWANWSEYSEILRRHTLKRLCIEIGKNVMDTAKSMTDDVDIETAAQAALLQLSELCKSGGQARHVSEHLAEAINRYEEAAKNGGKILGIPTGIKKFDQATKGFQGGQLIVIAAETKGGKTAWALNICMNAAEAGYPVGIFSLEMNGGEIVDRLVASNGRVDLNCMANGGFNVGQVTNVMNATARLSKLPIYIQDESGLTPMQFRASCRRLHRKHGIKMIVLDYLQLIDSGSQGDNRERQVAEASRMAKMTAKELNIPIIVLSQLNDDGKVRESRAISHDANVLAIIQNDPGDPKKNRKPETNILIKYNRSGPSNVRIPVTFHPQYTLFEPRESYE